MFFCDPCAKKRNWPMNCLVRSQGCCEMCGKHTVCNHIPSKHLPLPKPPDPTPLAISDVANAIGTHLKKLETVGVPGFKKAAAHLDGEQVCVRYEMGDGFWALNPEEARDYLRQLLHGWTGRFWCHNDQLEETG